MSEWWTYSLSDFLLFSPRTYQRLIELYNLAFWPLQLLTTAAGIAIIVAFARNPLADRVATIGLGLCWGWVAWAFHLERYAQINWAASWFALAFALQGALLVAAGLFGSGLAHTGDRGSVSGVARGVALIVVLGYPLLAPLAGRGWGASEAFGTSPDPTALATLILVMQREGAVRWLLGIVPIAWCAIGAATLLAMESPQAYVVVAVALVALALPLAMRRRAAPRAR
jgi:hypothetical protein